MDDPLVSFMYLLLYMSVSLLDHQLNLFLFFEKVAPKVKGGWFGLNLKYWNTNIPPPQIIALSNKNTGAEKNLEKNIFSVVFGPNWNVNFW